MKLKRYDTSNQECDNGELMKFDHHVKVYLAIRKRLDEALDHIDWMERNMTINDFPETMD